jgi:hypothetical protein
MSYPLQCRCGSLKGVLADTAKANRVICYCKDCQAFAHFLGGAKQILDEQGGSDIVQVLPKTVTFTQGAANLACMRLTGKGMLRWYAGCCQTPIGNTLATPKISFIGLLHTCLEGAGGRSLDDAFGPVAVCVYARSARGEPKPKERGKAKMGAWFFGNVLRARLNGDYKITPFFDIASGAPVASPQVLSVDDRARLMQKLQT